MDRKYLNIYRYIYIYIVWLKMISYIYSHEHYQMVNTEIRLIIFLAAKYWEALYSQKKQDQKLTVAQIMNLLL